MTFYDDLGITPDCSKDDIKKTYRKLAVQYHPDKGGDPAMFHKINEAYNTLVDDELRQQYDAQLNQPMGGNMFSNFGNFFQTFNVDINQLFRQMNIQFNRSKVQLPNDNIDLHITFEEAIQGCMKEIKRKIEKNCPQCIQTCNDCQGQGYQLQPLQQGYVKSLQQMQCPKCTCRGLNRVNEDCQCEGCKEGKIVLDISTNLYFPPHFAKSGILTIKGLGKQPHTFLELSSDLVITIVIDLPEHVTYDKETGEVFYTPTINVIDMICGCEILLPPCYEWPSSVQIPPLSLEPEWSITLSKLGLVCSEAGDRAKLKVKPVVNYNIPNKELIDMNEVKKAMKVKE